MPLMVKILKLQVEENAEGRVGYQTLSRIIVFLSLSLSLFCQHQFHDHVSVSAET
jgi:hypothetical protein